MTPAERRPIDTMVEARARSWADVVKILDDCSRTPKANLHEVAIRSQAFHVQAWVVFRGHRDQGIASDLHVDDVAL